jgi:hypothetical protein
MSFEEWCAEKAYEQHQKEEAEAIKRMHPEQRNRYLDPWFGWPH